MRAVGVSSRALVAAMLLELALLALAAGSAGVAAGFGLASALLPNVAASIDALYGGRVAGRLALDGGWLAVRSRHRPPRRARRGGGRPLESASPACPGRLSTLRVAESAAELHAAPGVSRAPRLRRGARGLCLGQEPHFGFRGDRRAAGRRRAAGADSARRRLAPWRDARARAAHAMVLGGQPAATSRALARPDGPHAGARDQCRRRRHGRGLSSDLHALAGRTAGRGSLFRSGGRGGSQADRIVALDAAGGHGGAADGENDRQARRLADPGRRNDRP